ncbi:MAG: SCO family protein [Bacteroidia bacterium]
MKAFIKKYAAWLAFFTIFLIGVLIVYFFIIPVPVLKIYKPSDINPALVDQDQQNNKPHRIADFKLLNQNGDTITLKNLDGKIYVADFFFTTCPTICPKMSDQMHRVYEKYKDNPQVMIVSHTVMPEVDSVSVLKAYADKYHADADKWIFLTGPKEEIYQLARKSYFAVITEGDGGVDDFIHTENFILVDKQKRIRGFYDGTSEEDVDRLIKEISYLLKEKN